VILVAYLANLLGFADAVNHLISQVINA